MQGLERAVGQPQIPHLQAQVAARGSGLAAELDLRRHHAFGHGLRQGSPGGQIQIFQREPRRHPRCVLAALRPQPPRRAEPQVQALQAEAVLAIAQLQTGSRREAQLFLLQAGLQAVHHNAAGLPAQGRMRDHKAAGPQFGVEGAVQ